MPGRLRARSHGRRADGCHLHDHHGRRAGHPDALAAAESPARAVRAADAGLGRPRRARGRRRRRRRRGRARDGRGDRRGAARTCASSCSRRPTARATRCGSASRRCRPTAERVVVLSGDTPLIEPETVRRAIAACSGGVGGALVERAARAAARLRPRRARRRARRAHRRGARREPEELALDEFNVGLYCFRRDALAAALPRLDAAQRAGRALPDRRRSALLAADGSGAVAVDEPAPETGEGVNTLAELAEREAALRARILRDHMLAGVRIVDPATTYVDGGVQLEPGCRLEPHVMLRGATAVGAGQRDRPLRDDRRRHDRRALPRRAVRLPAPRLHAGRGRPGRALRRAQEHERSASAPRCRT